MKINRTDDICHYLNLIQETYSAIVASYVTVLHQHMESPFYNIVILKQDKSNSPLRTYQEHLLEITVFLKNRYLPFQYLSNTCSVQPQKKEQHKIRCLNEYVPSGTL